MSRHEAQGLTRRADAEANRDEAARLRRSKELILERWEEQVRGNFPEIVKESPAALRDHLPEFLNKLIGVLSTERTRPAAGRYAEIGGLHAIERIELAGYSVDHVLSEFVILRKVIMDVLRAEAPLTESTSDLINDLILDEMRGAVLAFTRLQLEKMEKVASRLQFVLEATKVGLWELELSSNSFWKSKIVEQLYGRDVIQAEWRLEDLLKLIDDQDFFEREFQVVWPDGSSHWLFERGRVHRDRAGRPTCLTGAIADITSRKKTEEERAHMLALSKMDLDAFRLERDIREKFVATLSHDLRSPLSVARAGVQLLLRDSGDIASRTHLTRRILSSIDRIDRMIQGLLDADRLRAGQSLPIRVGFCDLRSVTQDAIEDLILMHGDRFILDAPNAVLGEWDCDELRRVIENIATNAVKYGSPGRPVIIALRQDAKITQITIHNEGPTIPPDEKAGLFDSFRKTRAGKVGRERSWGIGLTLVRGIVEAHHGTVRVESASDTGTTFIVELPSNSRVTEALAA